MSAWTAGSDPHLPWTNQDKGAEHFRCMVFNCLDDDCCFAVGAKAREAIQDNTRIDELLPKNQLAESFV